MSDVKSFIRFCESEFGTAVMDHETGAFAPQEQVTS